ncbi:MAG: hypothetical protein SF069_10305 [Phycisphaerae bacterium]|nr:hypothetical protein [Phycisphaerae bacterium]
MSNNRLVAGSMPAARSSGNATSRLRRLSRVQTRIAGARRTLSYNLR